MFIKQDRLLKDAMRELSESLDAQRIEPLHSGIGIGKLRPIQAPWTPVLQSQPPAHSVAPTTVPGPHRLQGKSKSAPAKAIPRLDRPPVAQMVPTFPKNSFATTKRPDNNFFSQSLRLVMAHVIDICVIVGTLVVGVLLLQMLFSDQHPFAGRAAMTQILLQTSKDLGWPILLGTIYGLFVAYWMFFKILAGYTIGQFITQPSPGRVQA